MTVYEVLSLIKENNGKVFLNSFDFIEEIHKDENEIKNGNSDVVLKWDSDSYPITKISFNETRPNISMNFLIYGKVNLPDDSPENLPKEFQTKYFRNFIVVRDGKLNLKSFNVSLNKEAYEQLKNNNIDISEVRENVFKINFENVDFFKKDELNIDNFIPDSYELLETKAYLKVINYFLSNYEQYNDGLIEKYGEESVEYLKSIGITEKGFYPKSVKENEQKKEYTEIIAKFKGLSTIPSYNVFIKKVNDNKNLNNADLMLYKMYKLCKTNEEKMEKDSFIKFLKDEQKAFENKHQEILKELYNIRCHILINNKWFENTAPDFNGIETTISKNIITSKGDKNNE